MKSFILKNTPLRERDLLVTVLNRERGKEWLRVPGVRRCSAKLKGHVQWLSWSSLHVVTGRRLNVVVDAERIERVEPLSLEEFRARAFLAAIIDAILVEEEAVDTTFLYLERATETITSSSVLHPMSVSLFWGFRLMEEAGYGLTTAQCTECASSLQRTASWSVDHKGFLCTVCSSDYEGYALSGDGMRVLRFFQHGGEDHAARLSLEASIRQEISSLLLGAARLLSGSQWV